MNDTDQIKQDLITMLKGFGIDADLKDIPRIMESGLDKFLDKQGKVITPENLDGLYIILNTLRP